MLFVASGVLAANHHPNVPVVANGGEVWGEGERVREREKEREGGRERERESIFTFTRIFPTNKN